MLMKHFLLEDTQISLELWLKQCYKYSNFLGFWARLQQ